jgi:hypothetical protein
MGNMYNTHDVKMSNTQHVQHTTRPNLVFAYKSHDVPVVQQLQRYNTKDVQHGQHP